MHRLNAVILTMILLLVGCSENVEKKEEEVREKQEYDIASVYIEENLDEISTYTTEEFNNFLYTIQEDNLIEELKENAYNEEDATWFDGVVYVVLYLVENELYCESYENNKCYMPNYSLSPIIRIKYMREFKPGVVVKTSPKGVEIIELYETKISKIQMQAIQDVNTILTSEKGSVEYESAMNQLYEMYKANSGGLGEVEFANSGYIEELSLYKDEIALLSTMSEEEIVAKYGRKKYEYVEKVLKIIRILVFL